MVAGGKSANQSPALDLLANEERAVSRTMHYLCGIVYYLVS